MKQEETKAPTPAEIKKSWENDKSDKKSWGDLYKDSVHWWATEIGINYITNTTVSVGLTYLFDKTRGEQYQAWLEGKLKGITNVVANKIASIGLSFITKSQLLLLGGHLLVPFMKDFHDNKHRQSNWIGDKLDAMQEMFGCGNEASKQNRADYKKLQKLVKAKPQEVSEDDARVLSKYGINSSFDFIEEKKTWKEVAKSRGRAVLYAAATNLGLGVLEASTLQNGEKETGVYYRKWAIPLGSRIGGFLGKYVPFFKNVFPDTAGFGKEYANDVILTAASTIGFSQGMNSGETGPKRDEMLARNEEYWATRAGQKAIDAERHAKTVDAGGFSQSDVRDIEALYQASRKPKDYAKAQPSTHSSRIENDRADTESLVSPQR